MIRRNITVRKYSTKTDNTRFERVKIIRATQTFGNHEIKFSPSIKGFVVKKKSSDGEVESVRWFAGDIPMEWKYIDALDSIGSDAPIIEVVETASAQKLLIIHDDYETNIVDLSTVIDFIKRGIVY